MRTSISDRVPYIRVSQVAPIGGLSALGKPDAKVNIDDLHEFARSKALMKRGIAAKHEKTLEEDLIILASDTATSVLRSLIENPNASEQVFEVLAENNNQDIRELLASREDLSEALITKLSKDKVKEVRGRIASNKATQLPILKKLLSDKAEIVKLGLANHPLTTQEMLMTLAMSAEGTDTQQAIIDNSLTTSEILHEIALKSSHHEILRVILNDHRVFEEDQVMILLILG